MSAPDLAATERRRFLLELLPKASIGMEIGVHLGRLLGRDPRRRAPVEPHLVDP